MQDFYLFYCVYFIVDVVDFDIYLLQVFGQFFGYLFGEGGDQYMFFLFDMFLNFFYEVINLIYIWMYFNGWVEQAGGVNDLFYQFIFGFFQFVVVWCCIYEDDLIDEGFKFREIQWVVVYG